MNQCIYAKGQSRDHRAGYMLAECAVSLALVAGTVAVVGTLIFRQTLAVREVRQAQIAGGIAELQIERLRAMPFDRIRNVEAKRLDLTSPAAGQLRDAEARITIRERDPKHPGLKHVIVEVRWRATRKRMGRHRVETLIADRAGEKP